MSDYDDVHFLGERKAYCNTYLAISFARANNDKMRAANYPYTIKRKIIASLSNLVLSSMSFVFCLRPPIIKDCHNFMLETGQ